MFIIVLVCFENIDVISRIQEKFHFTLQAGRFLAWQLIKQNLFVKEKKSQKAMAFPKRFMYFRKENCVKR